MSSPSSSCPPITGIHVSETFPFVFALPTVSGLALWLSHTRSFLFGVRLILALSLGVAATWIGVLANVEPVRGASDENVVVTGFPIQTIEGHLSGGAPEHLTVETGLFALIANFLLWAGAFAYLSTLVRRCPLWSLSWIAVFLAAYFSWGGVWSLVYILD